MTDIKLFDFNSKKSDGFNSRLTVCDEFEGQIGEQSSEQYEVIKSSLGSHKQPLILLIKRGEKRRWKKK